MRRLLLAAVLWMLAAASLAAVDANTATVAELDSVKGIGPATSRAILAERGKGPFKDWHDFITRVKGVREATAMRYSQAGLTINGALFAGFTPSAARPDPQARSRAAAEDADGARVLEQVQRTVNQPPPAR